MKAILEFNLPEDQTEYQLVNDASKMYSALWDMKHFLRNKVKHASDQMPQESYNTFVQCRDELNDILSHNNLDLDI
jgi:hypothetical protein